MLLLPNFDKYILVCVDANAKGTEGALMQYGRMVNYKSMKLEIHEKELSNS
jgi:hypothetical protein